MCTIRYRHHYLATLFEDFKFFHPDVSISFATFSSYWPANVIKPKAGDYANCCCIKCENPSLKLAALKSHKLIPNEVDIETVLRDIKEDNFNSEDDLKNEMENLLVGPKSFVQVKYLEWDKVEQTEVNVNTGRQNKATTQRMAKYSAAKDLAMDFLTDYKVLREHLSRNEVIKAFVKEKREEALDSEDMVLLQVDWAENGQIVLPNEVQSAYYGGRKNYSLHTGYQYSKHESGGFVSLSDENNHKAEAISAALEPKIKQLVEKGFKEFVFVSDSPTSQYRNGKSAYLTSLWAKNYGIKITWIFTEAGHGKSSADGQGGLVKNLVADKVNMCPDTVISTVEDIKNNIETSIEMFIHTKADIEKIQKEMPKVGPLVGATKVHMIVFDMDGKMKQKNLPNEVNFKSVRIKIGRQISRRGQAENLDDAILEPVRGSFQARRWQAAYEEVADELEENLGSSDIDDE